MADGPAKTDTSNGDEHGDVSGAGGPPHAVTAAGADVSHYNHGGDRSPLMPAPAPPVQPRSAIPTAPVSLVPILNVLRHLKLGLLRHGYQRFKLLVSGTTAASVHLPLVLQDNWETLPIHMSVEGHHVGAVVGEVLKSLRAELLFHGFTADAAVRALQVSGVGVRATAEDSPTAHTRPPTADAPTRMLGSGPVGPMELLNVYCVRLYDLPLALLTGGSGPPILVSNGRSGVYIRGLGSVGTPLYCSTVRDVLAQLEDPSTFGITPDEAVFALERLRLWHRAEGTTAESRAAGHLEHSP